MTRYLPFYKYKKHLGLDVNIKDARVRARAEVCNNVSLVCGGGRYIVFRSYPRDQGDDVG